VGGGRVCAWRSRARPALHLTELPNHAGTLESAAAFALDSLERARPGRCRPGAAVRFRASDPIRSPLGADQIGPGAVDLATLNPAALAPDGQRL
jgi:hypothetical protein